MTDQLLAKIEKSKETLKLASEMSQHYYQEPIVICYSGGKDSDVILRLAMDCLNPDEFEVLHSITTVDSPITNRYVNKDEVSAVAEGTRLSKRLDDIEDDMRAKYGPEPCDIPECEVSNGS